MAAPNDHYYALIMAGGGGTRLWPLSRSGRPKQLLPLVDDRSLFRTSVERLAPLFTPDRIYVVTGRSHVDALRADTPEIPAENFVVEPYGRDNGPAAALGIMVIRQRDPQATIAYLPSDHHIQQPDQFRGALQAAHDVAQTGVICTLGITPSYPSTGFGYVQRGAPLASFHGFAVYRAARFHEKPTLETATTFLASGDFSWNAGMFIMRADTALAEFSRQQPAIHAVLQRLAPVVDTPEYAAVLGDHWDHMTKISIDHAIMEHASAMAVIPVEMGWSDIGSWDALYDILDHDEHGNSGRGQTLMINTRNTLVFGDKLVVTIGVDDLVIVDTGDVLMVCHKNQTQAVRDAVAQVRALDSRYL